MSTQDRQSQTEAPTQRRRDKARKQGDVAKSTDLTNGLGLLVASSVLLWIGDSLGERLRQLVRGGISNLPQTLSVETAQIVLRQSVSQLAQVSGVFILAAMLAHLTVVLFQVGFQISIEPLQPNWNRINPINGFSRLFSMQSLARGILAVVKSVVMATIVIISIRSQLTASSLLSQASLAGLVAFCWDIVLHAALGVSIALVVTGFADYAYQRWQHESKLKMTKQEVKDERKDEEGDPMMKARIKKVQRELSQGRMLKDVATATVVLTNPTHYAIALRYDANSMNAPRVVAKGVDEVAKRIRELAREHDVPLLERRELARALYRTVDVGQEISPDLYHAIAEVVAYLHRIGRFRVTS